MRIAIAGAPRAGKTTLGKRLASELGAPLFSADDLIGTLDWSGVSADIATRLLARGPYVIEGVAVLRGLRKALDATTGKPCDRLLWLDQPRQELSPGQRRMFEADEKRLRELEPELRRRGVEVVRERRAAQPSAPAKTAREQVQEADPGPIVIESVGGAHWGDDYGGRGFG